MLDIRFVRENPEIVKENIRKKFQDARLPLVDEVLELDAKNRAAITEASDLRAQKNKLSKANGPLYGRLKKASEEEKAGIQAQIDANTAAVVANDARVAELEKLEAEYAQRIYRIMLNIPNIIDPSVPLGPDDSANVEVERFGEPVVPDYEIPYHTDIMKTFNGIDLDASGRVSGHCVPDRWRVRHRQLRRKAKCPQNSQRILGKSLERITDTANDTVCEILLPAVEID